jgi:hypothetical protein
MRRLQLFEWEDQPWLPRFLRDLATDHLRYAHTTADMAPAHEAIALRLAAALRRLGSNRIVDLCSGASGPMTRLRPRLDAALGRPVEIVLTDLFPNVDAFRAVGGDGIRGEITPVDAAAVPPALTGLRTMFAAFHHFPPEAAREVLADAVRNRSGIAIFEPLERTPRMLLAVFLSGLIRGFVLTPVIGHLSLARLLCTYVVPLGPLILIWDGVVSALRTYTVDELRDLSRGLGDGAYDWEAGRFPVATPIGAVYWSYLIGLPRE